MDARATKPIRRILLSNDDGIDAIGLKILHDIAVQFSDDVWVIAPSENRSGASRSITLRRDVAIQQIGPKRYSCSGTPADCIIFGMSQSGVFGQLIGLKHCRLGIFHHFTEFFVGYSHLTDQCYQ